MGCGASSEAGHRHPNNTYITREDLDAASERYLEGAEPSLHASPWDSELVSPDDGGAVDDEDDLKALDDRQRLRGGSIGAECDEPSSIALAARHTVAVMTARFHGIDDSVPPPPPSGQDADAKPIDTNRMNCWVDETSVHLPHVPLDGSAMASAASSASRAVGLLVGGDEFAAVGESSLHSSTSHVIGDAPPQQHQPLTIHQLHVHTALLMGANHSDPR